MYIAWFLITKRKPKHNLVFKHCRFMSLCGFQCMFSSVSINVAGFLPCLKNMMVGQMVTLNYPQGLKELGLTLSAPGVHFRANTLTGIEWLLQINGWRNGWMDQCTSYSLLGHTDYSQQYIVCTTGLSLHS